MKKLLLSALSVIALASASYSQCPAPEVTPWSDDVESLATTTAFTGQNCWTGAATTAFDWNITSGGTPSFGTGANAANSGVNFFYTEASGAAVGAQAILTSPEIDLTGLTVPMLRFYYHMFGNQMGTLNVEITDDAGATWNPVTTLTGAQQAAQADAFLLSETALGAYTGVVQFRFTATSNGSFEGDICLDDFSVVEAPTCPTPTALTLDAIGAFAADLSWTPGNVETEWTVEWGLAGYTPGTGSLGSVITPLNNPYSITGLTPTTSYDVYVRGNCAPGDTSAYVGPLNITTTVSCPQPTALVVNASDLTSANIGWTIGFGETEWQIDYDAPGFTPGTGAGLATTTTNPQDLTGLASDQLFEFYVRAICGPGDTSLWSGPLAFNTFNQGLYMVANNDCGPGFIDISATGTPTNMTDDAEVGVALPFTLLYQGVPINDITIADNGGILLGTQTGVLGFGNGTMATAANGIYAFWDDIQPDGDDVYYETIGAPGAQQFIIQWNDHGVWPGGNGTGTWQIILDEATNEIYTIYEDVEFNPGVFNNFGASASLGAAGPNQDIELSFNNTQYLTDNSCTHYYYTNCPTPTNFAVTYTTNDEGAFTWGAGLAGEVDWTYIIVEEGVDPATGTPMTTNVAAVIASGLNDATVYDVYIYADCDPGVLQSGALIGQFATLPNCSDVTAITTATAIDSVMTTWNWVESSGVGTYPVTGFNLEYGWTGFTPGSGTTVNSDVNFDDTTFDASFLGGAVYDIYVQAICGTDSSYQVGPIQFTMPVTNDSTCLSEALAVDGTVYTFDNTGATIALNEGTIAPPATGFNTSDGWGNSNIDFTTWFTFDAPASGNVRITGEHAGFDGQVAVYEVTTCDDFTTYTLIGANDDDVDGGSAAPRFSICGLTPGNTYYLMHDSQSTFATGQYTLALTEIVVEAGTSNGILNVCTGDTVDLTNGITGQDLGGTWVEAINTANFADPIFPSAGLAYQIFDFEYFVVDGCAVDSIDQQVEIYGPSSAGNDGTLSVCQNEPFNLLSGLSGNVDIGGTWIDPNSLPMTSADTTASSIPGSYNFDYITDNGVCPSDTANVVVIVSPSCDYLNIEDIYFGNMTVYPNPSTGLVFIANYGSTEVFNYTVTDIQGKVVATKDAAINGETVTEINLNKLETGVYFINVFNQNTKGTFRVIIE